MKHDDLNFPVATLTPEEAVRLGELRTIGDTYIAKDIYTAFYNTHKDLFMKDYAFYMDYALATVWNAGRIEGIRAERARRRKSRELQ